MLGWSLNLFRIRGIQLAVHFSFVLFLAYYAYEGWQDGGLPGLVAEVCMTLAFFTCVILHELGHSFTAMHYGIGVRRILLMPIGGMAEFDSIPRQPSRELLITLAGPAVNFAIAALLWGLFSLPINWMVNRYTAEAAEIGLFLLKGNLLMGCFNLLPVFPMDGGRIFRALLAIRLPYLRATYWAATVGKVLAVVAALVAFFVYDDKVNANLTAALFMFIYFAGDAEYRALLRREREDAEWRAMVLRLHQPPANEPPILTS
jgi:Zn-dependent protease